MKNLMYAAPLALALAGCSGSDSAAKEEKKVTATESIEATQNEEKDKPIVPLTYDDKDLEADMDGEFDIELKLGEGYEVKSVKGAEVEDWGDGEVNLTGTIAQDKKAQKVVLKISNGQETRKEILLVENDENIIAAIEAKEQAKAEKKRLANLKEKAIANAQKITYNHLIKTKDGYKGEMYYIGKAEVAQAFEEDGVTMLFVNTTNNGYGFWGDPIAVFYQGTTEAIADDFVQVYGELGEQYEYQTKIGGINSVPSLLASEVKVLK